MTNIYLMEQGSYLRKRDNRIVCDRDGETLLERPLKDIGMVVIFGAVQVSVQALLALLENGCDVSMMTQNGHFRGRLVPALGKNSILRASQYRLCTDETYRLETSRRIVSAKIANSIAMLRAYHYSGSNPMRFDGFDDLDDIAKKAQSAESLESLRGYEGQAAKRYYEGYRDALTAELQFAGREYYPSPDPVNAIMSFGYSFVARELQGLIEANGLDPYIGFFHDISYGRASLSLDLLEEYRSILVDRLTLTLFNRRILDAGDFEMQEDGGCYLKRDVVRIFIKHYEETVAKEALFSCGKRRSFRYIFREQTEALKKALSEGGRYMPYTVEP
jgi:CRISPR-associated protein Cas1